MDPNELLGAYKREVYKRPYDNVVTWSRNYLWRELEGKHACVQLPGKGYELHFSPLGALIEARRTKSPLWIKSSLIGVPLLSVLSITYFNPDDSARTQELDPVGGLEASIRNHAKQLRTPRH